MSVATIEQDVEQLTEQRFRRMSFLGGESLPPVDMTGLPPGLVASIGGSAIVLSGTPTSAGTYSVTVGVTDAQGSPASRTFGFTVNALPSLVMVVALYLTLERKPMQLALLRDGDWARIATMAIGSSS